MSMDSSKDNQINDASQPVQNLGKLLQENKLFPPDDLVYAMMGLLHQVAELHAQGRVANISLDTVSQLENGQLALTALDGMKPKGNMYAIHDVQPQVSSALKLVGNYRVTQGGERGRKIDDLSVIDGNDLDIDSPVYITRLRNWENELGHHDEITDVFQLGMIMAALSCGLDFAEHSELERFSLNRDNLFAISSRLNPVVASLIIETTELNRHERVTDVAELARKLDSWRERPAGIEVERVKAEVEGIPNRRAAVLSHLRDRLFDLSRRNRLIHFRSTQSSINFTDASMPMVMRIESVKADSLCTWQGKFTTEVLQGKKIQLNRWLRFEDQPQIPSQLDRIIQENRRNKNEYGFSSLRLTVAFLHWHNLKEAPEERISSPLLWLPVEVVRRKGVRDNYVLTCKETVAEFNPALRHMLKQLYDIELPETVDLSETSLDSIHEEILAQIHESEPGVRLDLQKRPSIRIIMQRAVQRVTLFKRRHSRSKQSISAKADFNYSREDYRPLGLALFNKFVKPDPLPQRLATGGSLAPKQEYMVSQTERKSFGQAGGEGHKFSWEVDLTHVTLANFNYKKMTLVRDYNALIEMPDKQPAFDQVFSIEPKPFEEQVPPPIPVLEQWGVVASDATQEQAVAFARSDRSYIIQGPPGTGKSQTITNLIADYTGQGKRVLFVCEKRAALDVVFHRLGQAGLDGLATIIHDSQDDKKSFIAELREHYERWGKTSDGLSDAQAMREQTVNALREHLAKIAEFEKAVGSTNIEGELSLRDLVQRASILPLVDASFGAEIRETLPSLYLWDTHLHMAQRICNAMRETIGIEQLAAHPFARLTSSLIRNAQPYSALTNMIESAETLCQRLDPILEDSTTNINASSAIGEAYIMCELAERMTATGLTISLDLLDPLSEKSKALQSDIAQLAKLEADLEVASQEAQAWHDPLKPSDTLAALELAYDKEGSIFSFLSKDWSKLKTVIEQRYDFSSHAVRPKITAVLETLRAMHIASDTLENAKNDISQNLGTSDISELLSLRTDIIENNGNQAFDRALKISKTTDGQQTLARIAQYASSLRSLNEALKPNIDEAETLSFDQLGELLRDLRESLDDLPDILPFLIELHDADSTIISTLTKLNLSLEQIEAIIIDETIASQERIKPEIRRFDIDQMINISRRASAARELLRDQNSDAIRATLHNQFRKNVKLSETSITQLNNEQRSFKKIYATGRRELEHEFGKSMRYKSIREIASGDSGRVVNDLKPVWLMSPLSVSDTLPLKSDLFDVVIFDEASQIPTEDAIPALCRSKQVIIVGDEMQLPPTSFFSASSVDEDMEIIADEDGEKVAIVLDADSLLSQAARNLPATLLAWHYRSRYEALISFSNAAFYAGELVTIPDNSLRMKHEAGEAVASENQEAWLQGSERLLKAPITCHRIEDGLYQGRANIAEARYIAGLVRELLFRKTGQSIGIVAFSEAQQSEIEDALERMASEDEKFSNALIKEVEREEDGQFNGLFVKNLENVQGDERDIIIMSICYAPGPNGKMVMNFGPINQRGGEKRLNVIFSRAKKHMAIISTIAPEAITNIHNDGARALRSFLSFAEEQSRGSQDNAQAVLAALNPDVAETFDTELPIDLVRSAIAESLRERGHEVHEHVGGASFRCDIAIVDPLGGKYALAILLDRKNVADDKIEERFVFQPTILRAFGWRVIDVPVISWLRARDPVIERIELELKRSSWELVDSDPLTGTSQTKLEKKPVSEKKKEPESSDETDQPQNDASGMTEYRYVAGNSNKFWRIGVSGCDLTVEFGRVGTKGQRVIKSFEDEDRAKREANKLTLEKTRKGYEEFG